MEKDHNHDSSKRVPRRLFITHLQERRVFVYFARCPGYSIRRHDRGELAEKLALVCMVPNVFLGINLQQVLAGNTNEAVAQGWRQILWAERTVRVLAFECCEHRVQFVEKSLLKRFK